MNNLVERLRKRAAIRRQIDSRKSVQEGKPDRLADLLEEAADEIDKLNDILYDKAIAEDAIPGLTSFLIGTPNENGT